MAVSTIAPTTVCGSLDLFVFSWTGVLDSLLQIASRVHGSLNTHFRVFILPQPYSEKHSFCCTLISHDYAFLFGVIYSLFELAHDILRCFSYFFHLRCLAKDFRIVPKGRYLSWLYLLSFFAGLCVASCRWFPA